MKTVPIMPNHPSTPTLSSSESDWEENGEEKGWTVKGSLMKVEYIDQ